ncbi:hypothetical protein Pst134EA_009030 [Puccinia striiformis f. sp. tritici]|uniref:hypothetical protein n=1 Tax=Puccinia striiformis f. sp. tritici TaxID=168172 RepID=UPI002007F1AC|nr:hypothetical protein Pst134EA_009030 [Puccinia striiformis f. sp. tritici]KAH9468487.1 hypothetical protein Pst134EA_009030 [Puccinia striiformis f. sp. tritici]
MQILLDWLTTEGNFERWRGDVQGGLTKEASAAEIIAIYAENGIHHQNCNKDVRSKIQELQDSYSKACDWLRNTGEGIRDEDIANGTHNIRDEVMGSRAFTNPQDTVDLTLPGVPDPFNPPPSSDEDDDLPDPTQTQEPRVQPAPINHTPDVSPLTNVADVAHSVLPAADSALAAKGTPKSNGKPGKRSGMPSALEKAIQDSCEFRHQALKAKQDRDKAKLTSEENRAAKRLKLDERRMAIEEGDANVRKVQAETEQVRTRIGFMKELKEAGFADSAIVGFLTWNNNSAKDPGTKPTIVSVLPQKLAGCLE